MVRRLVGTKIATLVALAAALLVIWQANAQASQLFGATGSNGVDGTLYSIDPTTAAATAIRPVTVGGTGVPIAGLAVHPTTGVLYAVTAEDGNLPGPCSLALSGVTVTTGAPLLSPSTESGRASLLFLVAAMLLGGTIFSRRAAD